MHARQAAKKAGKNINTDGKEIADCRKPRGVTALQYLHT
jgi:hypothetical protein